MERLISQAKKGDPDAFTALMESQMQNMYKAARSVLCNDFRYDSGVLGKIFPVEGRQIFSYLDDQDPTE